MENTVRTNGNGLNDSGGLLTGLLIGALAGFGAMLLLAPRSGKNTRTRIMQKSTELQGRASDTFDDLLALTHYDDRQILAGQISQK
ncbi:MAG TPA: YtxH domain-containing protein [Anaerolineales bacterium]|jgi:gas vesicle protein